MRFNACRLLDATFSLFDRVPLRHKMPFTYIVYVYSDVLLSKGLLGSKGGKHLNN